MLSMLESGRPYPEALVGKGKRMAEAYVVSGEAIVSVDVNTHGRSLEVSRYSPTHQSTELLLCFGVVTDDGTGSAE